jgi:hypothetical protein
MKISHLIIVSIVLITACKCNNDQDKPTAEDSILVIPDTLLVYDVNTDTRTWKKFTEVPDSAFTATRIVNGLNQKYPEVQLQLIKQSNDTLYVTVPNNEFLGERMGNAGAVSWFSDAVLNLTGVPGVTYVNMQMEKRSHALPGVFKKEDVKGYQERRDSIPAV